MIKTKAANIIFILLFITVSTAFGQYAGHDLGISVSYSYTTTSKLFPFPNSIDPILRESHKNFEDIASYSVEIRYRLTTPLVLGLSVEYLEKTSKGNVVLGGPSGSIIAEADEGFSVVPVELSAYYILPFSTDEFKFHMGGGLGVYFGNHIRNIQDAGFENVNRDMAYGIHVIVGMDYLIEDFISIRGEMKFRDPQFEVESKYDKSDVRIVDNLYVLPSSSFESKINVDGITFMIGAVFHIF